MVGRRTRIASVSLALAVVATALPGICARPASAQRPPASTFEINKIIAAEDDLAPEEEKLLNQYFDFYLALFYKPQRPDDQPNFRTKIYKIVARAPNTKAHQFVNKKLLDAMLTVLRKHPERATKVNAMLLIGDLNESVEGPTIRPLPEALPYLTSLVGMDRPQYDFLKPAALIGIARFAEERGIPKDQIPALTETLLKIVEEPNPPAGRNASAHNFMRRSAARALAAMKSAGPDNRVLTAFETIAADPKLRPSFRCEFSRFIGELDFPQGAKVDYQGLASIVGHQAVEVCRQELDRAKGTGQTSETPSRRLIMYALDSSNEGLQKLSGASGGDKTISELKRKFDALLRELDDTEKAPDSGLADAVEKGIGEIEALLPPKPQLAAVGGK